MNQNFSIGLYEKALPPELDWEERFRIARNAGYDYMELSIDESDLRLSRLDWDWPACRSFLDLQHKTGITVPSLCLSGHRRFPIGSPEPKIRTAGMNLFIKAIELASRLGIRIVQVAGYDTLLPQDSSSQTKALFCENLHAALGYASSLGVTLAIENVEVPFMNSLKKIMEYVDHFKSPYLQVYADMGNLSALNMNLEEELHRARGHIVAVHIKDTVEHVCRDIPFSQGRVDFDEIFFLLKNIGYRGMVLLEMWSSTEKDDIKEIQFAYELIAASMRCNGLLL